jgi:exo-beta-1,3-glucanase (GH17 family)
VLPSLEAIAEDLRVLYDAGFRGIVTYSAGGIFGDIPRLAREAGFDGVVMGIWTPGDPDETLSAINAAPFIDGYVVGNEGIYFNRYDFATLEAAIRDLRQKTNKWVTTTEVISLYGDPNILGVGDWIFPNVHPYWQGIVDPLDAA